MLLEKNDFTGPGRVIIFGRRFDHVKNVLQAGIGESLSCGIVNGKMGTGRIMAVHSDSLEMDISLEIEPPEPLPLTLVLALPRPKMLKRIFESVTSLGVKEIYLINSWRVEKSFWQSPVLEARELEKYLRLGLEQSKDTMMPRIHQKRFFTKFVKQELPVIGKDSFCMTAHPKTSNICPMGVNKKTCLVIGPEGGFIDLEIKTLEESGFTTYNIGQRILRVETATTFLISRLFAWG